MHRKGGSPSSFRFEYLENLSQSILLQLDHYLIASNQQPQMAEPLSAETVNEQYIPTEEIQGNWVHQ